MENFWDTLEKISGGVDTTKYGIDKIKEVKNHWDDLPAEIQERVEEIQEKETEIFLTMAGYFKLKRNSIRNTIILCVLLVVTTVLLCVFF